MKSAERGDDTPDVEVTNISEHGFWMQVGGQELYVLFADFPQFKGAKLGQLLDVTMKDAERLFWPQLKIDLTIENVRHPK
jgi:hypothetical protein